MKIKLKFYTFLHLAKTNLPECELRSVIMPLSSIPGRPIKKRVFQYLLT